MKRGTHDFTEMLTLVFHRDEDSRYEAVVVSKLPAAALFLRRSFLEGLWIETIGNPPGISIIKTYRTFLFLSKPAQHYSLTQSS